VWAGSDLASPICFLISRLGTNSKQMCRPHGLCLLRADLPSKSPVTTGLFFREARVQCRPFRGPGFSRAGIRLFCFLSDAAEARTRGGRGQRNRHRFGAAAMRRTRADQHGRFPRGLWPIRFVKISTFKFNYFQSSTKQRALPERATNALIRGNTSWL
jgi:hypothetical protein